MLQKAFGSVRRHTFYAIVGWSALIGISLTAGLVSSHGETLEVARQQAMAYINKDIAFRSWAASHGGVYVPPTATTPPNPYLAHVPDRDIVSTTGKQLTLMNPAYMLREMQNNFPGPYGERTRITSLKPLNPNNAPDAWEAKALVRLAKGEKEYWSIDQSNSTTLRMIRPFHIEPDCLKCHAQQGYKLGDLRGGISVAISLQPYLDAEANTRNNLLVGHGSIWLCGLIAIGVIRNKSLSREAEKRKTMDDLAASEERFRQISASALDAIIMIDDQGLVSYWNAAAERMFGHSVAEAIDQDLHRLVAPEHYYAAYKAGFASFLKDGKGMAVGKLLQLVARRKDGSEFPVELSISATLLTGRQVAIGIIRDISDRKLAEEKYGTIIKASMDAFLILAPSGKLLEVNPAACQLTGYSREALLTMSSHDLDATLDEKETGNRLAYIERSRYARFESVWRNSQGDALDVEISITALGEGQELQFIEFVRDISERKRTSAELAQSHQQLESRVQQRTAELHQAVRDMEAFSYSVSHDLRAPLRAISGYPRLLLDEQQLSEDGRKMLLRIEKNAIHMAQLIDDILQYSRLGRQTMAPRPVDLAALAQEAADELHESYPAVAISIAPLPRCACDPTMMRQVFANLLGNACKFSAPCSNPSVKVGAYQDADDTIYFVSDNGVGFDPQYAQNLFGMFQRLHPGNQFSGTGVGLAIVKRLVERHGGRIWAAAQVGVGATFYFSLGKFDADSPRQPAVTGET